MSDDLVARARERAEQTTPDDWGHRITLEEGEHFLGRWRGETTDAANENRRVYLLWDEDDQPCYSRHYVALGREVDRAAPAIGCTIAIVRGADYTSQLGTAGFSFGVEIEPCDEPLPGDAATDDLPF